MSSNQKKLEEIELENERKEEAEVIKANEQKKQIDKLYHAFDVIEVPAPAAKESAQRTDSEEQEGTQNAFQKKTKPAVSKTEARKDGNTFTDSKN